MAARYLNTSKPPAEFSVRAASCRSALSRFEHQNTQKKTEKHKQTKQIPPAIQLARNQARCWWSA